jgi:hypothetical protein
MDTQPCNHPEPTCAHFVPAEALAAQKADYEAVLTDHRRLVREIDVLLNGEAGAAKQASLCDVVAQIVTLTARCETLEAALKEYGQHDFLICTKKKAICCGKYFNDKTHQHGVCTCGLDAALTRPTEGTGG